MRRTQRALPLLSLLSIAVLPALSHAAPPPGIPGHRGETVAPRVVEFRQLPRFVPVVGGPVRERVEGINPEAEAIVEEAKQHPHGPGLRELGAITLDPTAGGGQPFAPTVGNGFEGITQGGYIPSEPAVAAGPLNIFSTGNVSVTVTDKDGTNRVETNGKTFFGVPAAEGDISDAQCYYDAVHGRFVALCFTQGTSPSNYSNFYLAISKTNDARGAWWLYKFDMTKDGTTQTTNWSDYQALGISEDKLAMTGQQFSFAGNQYKYQKIRIIDRALAYSGAAVTYVDFANFAAPPGGDTNDNFVTKAARNLTAGDNTIHCLCVRTGSGSRVTYRTVTGSPSSPTLSAGTLVMVGAYSAPPDAAQLGSGTLVATNDCRPTDFYVRNGVLICAWHTAATISSTSVSAIRLFRMRTSDQVVLTDETYGQASTFYYYPAVTVDSVGTIFLGFDRSSSTEYPSAYATGKRRSDATLQPSALLKAGLSATSQSRWGDFTGIDNDASLQGPGGSSAWYAGQWTKASNTFGTWINKLTFTYGQVAGSVQDDCDGSTGTTGDRAPLAGVTLTLKQGVTTLATTTSDASGNYNFGYLETGIYDVVITPPAGGSAVDATAGSGGTSQTRVSASDLQVNLTNAQTSISNAFLVTSTHAAPASASISPNMKNVGDPTFVMTVNGSNFVRCSVVQLDGSPRTTTWVSASQLTAQIPASDMSAGGMHAMTVVSPAPGGGTSNSQTFTVSGSPDNTPPTVHVTAPVGGETWTAGSTQNITWTATDDVGVASIDIAYSSDGGSSYPNAIATGIANSGTYAWSVPGAPSSTVRVRVTAHDGAGNQASDASPADLTLSGWTIAASAGAHGTITPSGVVGTADGATPGFTIAADGGCVIADVLVNGVSVGAVTGYTFPPVHSNQTIAASFAVTLNVTVVGSGTVAKSPDQPSYADGSNVTLTATPSAGWHFVGWSGDASGSTNPLGVTMNAAKNITATFSQNIYAWNQTSTAAWGTATNWTPSRTTPSTDDVLLFNGGGVTTATGVPTQNVAQLLISGGTSVALQPAAAAALTITGSSGNDFDVASGSTLTLNSVNALTIALGASATGTVGGTVAVTGAAHRLSALGSNALVFQGGSQITLGSGFTGNIFGDGTGMSALNSVVLQNGALLAQSAGANPFGASAPNSVLTFQAGSRFRLDGSLTPAFSGRTYADFEKNNSGTTNLTGGSAFSIDSVIVTQGTLNLAGTGGGSVKGSLVVKSGTTLNLSPASGTPTYTLAGASPQRINVLGTFSTTSNLTLAVNNPNGIQVQSNVTLSGPLTFTSGVVTTGASVLAIASTGSVSGASQGAGYVAGNLKRNFATGASSRTFDVGDASVYAPIAVVMSGAAAGFDVTGSTQTPDHPNLASAPLNPAKSANRWWTLTPTGSPSFTGFDATFNFSPSDLDAGATPANFLIGRYSGAWSSPTTGARTATSTQATGVTAFGDFVTAEIKQYALNVSVVGGGTVAKAPDQAGYAAGTPVTLTATPGAGWQFVGWSGDTTTTGNPLNWVMISDRTVVATFADIASPTATVTYPNGGETLTGGSTASLTWTATDNAAVTVVDLKLSRTGVGGPYDPIATGIANTGSYDWIVTDPATSDAFLQVTAHDAASNTGVDASDAAFSITGTVGVPEPVVAEFALDPVSPNPIHRDGSIGFACPKPARVHLSVIDLQGREVAILADEEFGAGLHRVSLSGKAGLGTGLYFARLRVAGLTFVRRFVLVR